jgi:formylglycine-generating enzyme required for sulfatase activity
MLFFSYDGTGRIFMKRYWLIIGLLCCSGIASGQVGVNLTSSAGNGNTLYVPASAHVVGSGGTNWRTDLAVHRICRSAFRYELDPGFRHGSLGLRLARTAD